MTQTPCSRRQGGLGVLRAKVSDCRRERSLCVSTVYCTFLYFCNISEVNKKTEQREAFNWDSSLIHTHRLRSLSDTHQCCRIRLSHPGSSYHIISLSPRIGREIRTPRHPQQSSLLASLIPILLPCRGAFADPMVILPCPGPDTNSPLLVM